MSVFVKNMKKHAFFVSYLHFTGTLDEIIQKRTSPLIFPLNSTIESLVISTLSKITKIPRYTPWRFFGFKNFLLKLLNMRVDSGVFFDEKLIGTTFKALKLNTVEINAFLCYFLVFFDVFLPLESRQPKTKLIFRIPVKFYYRIRPKKNMKKVVLS